MPPIMLDTFFLSAVLLLQLCCTFSLLAGLVYFALLIRRSRLVRILVAMDELLDGLIDSEGEPNVSPAPTTNGADDTSVSSGQTDTTRQYRDRLASLAAGGQAKQYLGRTLTVEQIDAMSDEEIESLYSRYQSRLGAAMTKSLGLGLIKLYCSTASKWLPIDDMAEFENDLQSDPFVEHALGGICCQLYHRYGAFLAPLTAALATAKHCVRDPPVSQISASAAADDVGRRDYAVGTATPEPDTTRSAGRDPAEGP